MTAKYPEEQMTAYLLDALDEQQRQEIEKALADDPALAGQLNESRAFCELVKASLAEEHLETLTAEQTQKINQQLTQYASPKGHLMSFYQLVRNAPVRYASVAAAAGSITIALFFVMHQLIGNDGIVHVNPSNDNKKIEFVRVVKPPEPAVEKQLLPEKVTQKAPPAPRSNPTVSSSFTHGIPMAEAPIEMAPDDLQLIGSLDQTVPADTGLVPLVRVQPIYPPAAASQRIEGWVELQFTIGTTGRVKNPQVLAASPSDIFNQAALQAIKKWKYKPRLENGDRVETHGVTVRLKFKLDENR